MNLKLDMASRLFRHEKRLHNTKCDWRENHAPDHKYYIFGQEGARHLASDLEVSFLGEIPIVQSIREAGDFGRPAAMQSNTPLESSFREITQNVVQEVVRRNKSLPPTEAIKITTMAGCSAVKN